MVALKITSSPVVMERRAAPDSYPTNWTAAIDPLGPLIAALRAREEIMLTDNPATLKNLEDFDEHVTAVVRRTYQELLSEIHTTRLELEKLRMEVEELKQQVPPKLRTI
jgi:hypothetical protein